MSLTVASACRHNKTQQRTEARIEELEAHVARSAGLAPGGRPAEKAPLASQNVRALSAARQHAESLRSGRKGKAKAWSPWDALREPKGGAEAARQQGLRDFVEIVAQEGQGEQPAAAGGGSGQARRQRRDLTEPAWKAKERAATKLGGSEQSQSPEGGRRRSGFGLDRQSAAQRGAAQRGGAWGQEQPPAADILAGL